MSPGRTGLLAILLTAGTAAVLPAQTEEKRLELSGFVGGMSLDQDLGTASNIYMTVTGGAESSKFGELFGFRASWGFTPNIAVGFDFSYGTNPYRFTVDDDAIGTVGLPDQFEAERIYYGGSVLARIPLSSGLVPYGVFGVGQLETRPNNPIGDISSVSSIDWSFGGGVKYWLPPLPWLGFGFDLRYHTASDGLTFADGGSSPKGTEFTVSGMVRLF